MKRIVVYDTEFLEDGRTIELISIGMVDNTGHEFYAVNQEAPWDRISQHPWLLDNVVPHLPRLTGLAASPSNVCAIDFSDPCVRSRTNIARLVQDFLWSVDELWANYAAYDFVVLAQLFGTLMDRPRGTPMFTHELQQLWETAGKPPKPVKSPLGEHHALHDARYGMDLYQRCSGGKP